MQSVDECYRGNRVRVFRIDHPRVLAGLRSRADELIRTRPDVLEVRLFGSVARGDAHPGSDADLLIVLRDGAAPFLERIPELARHMTGVGIGCDVIAYTAAEIEQARERGDRFIRVVDEEGIVLARRPGLGSA